VNYKSLISLIKTFDYIKEYKTSRMNDELSDFFFPLRCLLNVRALHFSTVFVNLFDEHIYDVQTSFACLFIILSPLIDFLDKLMDHLALVLIGDNP